MKIEDLIDGEYYSTLDNHNVKSVFISNKLRNYKYFLSSVFKKNNSWSGNNIDKNIKLASKEERDWLDACIEADKFIPLEEFLKIYKPKFIVGKWYKCTCNSNYYKCAGADSPYFKSSEVISPNGQDDFSVGYNNFETGDHLEEYFQEYLTDLTEIQKYLPQGHPEKITTMTKEFPKEGCCYEINDKLTKYLLNRPFNKSDTKVNKSEAIGIGWNQNSCWWLKTKNSGKTEYSLNTLFNILGYENEEYLLEEAKIRYPIGTKFYPIFVNTSDIYTITDNNFTFHNNNTSITVSTNLGNESIVKNGCSIYHNGKWAEIIELPKEQTEFKKGDYIVYAEDSDNDGFRFNYCYKQKQNEKYLCPEITDKGSVNNGWSYININKDNWRYATPEEIAEYERIGKPYNVTTLEKPKPNMEEIQEECKKRFPIGCTFINLIDRQTYTIKSSDKCTYNIIEDYIDGGEGKGYLYYRGEYAELVSLPKEEESGVEYVEYINTKYKGKIVKVEDWCCGSYCKVIFYDGIKEQPFKHLVKKSTKEAYNLQNYMQQNPLTPKECYNTEIEVGDIVETNGSNILKYSNKATKIVVTEIDKDFFVQPCFKGDNMDNHDSFWVYPEVNINNFYYKIITKANSYKQVDVSSPKVTNKITITKINTTINRDRLVHINAEVKTTMVTVPKIEVKKSVIKNIQVNVLRSLTI